MRSTTPDGIPMIDLTPIDIASAGLVSGTTTQEADVRRDLERNRLNDIKKPEDQVQGLPHGGIQAPTGDVPSDMPHDQILPKAIERRASTCSAKTMAEDKISLSGTADYLRKEDETKGNGYQHKSKLRDLSESDALLSVGKKRERWFQVWRPKHGPRRPPKSLDDATEIPLAKANFLSQLFYSWATPIMILGYQRPLQATDLWKMDRSREAEPLADAFLATYRKRREQAEEYNLRLVSELSPSMWRRMRWNTQAALSRAVPSEFEAFSADKQPNLAQNDRSFRYRAYESEWRRTSGRKRASIIWALNDVLTGFWTAGLFKIVGDMCQLMVPLVTKQLILHSQKVYAAHQNNTPQPNIGPGIGMAFGVLFLTITASLGTHQFFFKSMSVGVMARATLISATYKQVVSLTVRERAMHPPGKITSNISADISRIDSAAQWFHAVWTAPVQVLVCLILLLTNIGPSALVGMCLFLLMVPLQTTFMKISFSIRQKSMKWTDGRSRILQELLSSMQIIKQFTYERPFMKRIFSIRKNELIGVRKLMYIRSANQALAFSVPVMASVVTFACYAGIGNELTAAEVFTSLSWFLLLRQPLMFLPRALSSISDARSAVERISPLFEAHTTEAKLDICADRLNAVCVENATFQWLPQEPRELEKKDIAELSRSSLASNETPFRLTNIDLVIPRGKIVAIVGPIGSGKSSLLQGMLGDMEQMSGSVKFGGTVGYAQQQAWIQNLSVQENVTSFGNRPFDKNAYWSAMHDSALLSDLRLLPDGDLSEIGERGINISGGQKQRINIARVLYRDPDIAFFDDVLSALDAHVGQWVFDHALLGLRRRNKTVVLVTHAVHLLHKVDYIYTMQDGRIAEEGSYDDLLSRKGPFHRLIQKFGGESRPHKGEDQAILENLIAAPSADKGHPVTRAAGTGKLEGRLIVAETRTSGSVGTRVYLGYFLAARAIVTGPLLLVCAVLNQGAQITATLWLAWWQQDNFGQTQGFYMGIYAALGILQTSFTFAVGAAIGFLCYYASSNLFEMALERLFHAPTSVFDTTPLGRLMGILTKDVDSMDNQLADSWRMFVLTLVNCIGSVVIITVFLHYFIAVVFVVGCGYAYFVAFYRSSAREVKRLDAMTRSLLYSHFSESLTGLSTIRAFGEENRFIRENAFYIDLEDRAYLLTCANQRWLSVRLDCTGGLLSFAVAIMAAKGGAGLNGAQIGLVLSYMTTLVQQFGMFFRQSMELENNMNAAERILQNATLPQEKAHDIASTLPSPNWPDRGVIRFDNCTLSYRKGLPAALKGITLTVGANERLGVIGRTGAGKSSLTVALYRLVELTTGSIKIDGIDIASLGLRQLRSKLAIIPQDPKMFAGTIRNCLDPFEEYDDARLHDAMRRASLLGADDTDSKRSTMESGGKFSLETRLEEEGLNLSVGERSLISLARALVKNAKITVLDEATASIDLVTDQIIQETINRNFADTTLICIAHRLRTIIGWDRIAVMDAGEIVELGTPKELFEREDGMFRSLCDKSSIDAKEIENAQAETSRQRAK